MYAHLRASLVCRSAWTPCALAPSQRHFYGSSPRKHRGKQKYRYESNFLSADWHALPHLGHCLGINSGGELADSGHVGICVEVQLFENPGRKVILWYTLVFGTLQPGSKKGRCGLPQHWPLLDGIIPSWDIYNPQRIKISRFIDFPAVCYCDNPATQLFAETWILRCQASILPRSNL